MVGLAAIGRVLLIAVFTVIEAGGLTIWLVEVRGDPTAAAVAIGLTVLATALLVEHVLTGVAVNGLPVGLSLGQAVVISLSETAI